MNKLLLLATFLPPGFSFFIHWLLVGRIGVAEYGEFAYLLQVFSVLCLLADFGITALMMSRGKEALENVSSYFWGKFLSYILVFLAASLFLETWLEGLLALGLSFQIFVGAYYRLRNNYWVFLIIRAAPWVLFLVCFFLSEERNAIYYLDWYLAVNFIVSFVAIAFFKEIKTFWSCAKLSLVASIYRKSFPIFISSIFISVTNAYLIELHYLKEWVGQEELGVFAIFVQFSMLSVLVQSYLTTLYLPRLKGRSLLATKKMMDSQIKNLALSFVLFGIVASLLSPYLYSDAQKLPFIIILFFLFFAFDVFSHSYKVYMYVYNSWFLAIGYALSALLLIVLLSAGYYFGKGGLLYLVYVSIASKLLYVLFFRTILRNENDHLYCEVDN